MMSNPERCTDLFVIMFKLEGGWVGQNQSELCSNLEIRTEKWTVPNTIIDTPVEWECIICLKFLSYVCMSYHWN